MPLLDLIRSHLFRWPGIKLLFLRALLCTWLFTQQSIWQKSRKWGLRYILTGGMFSQMAYSLLLKICMLFSPSRVILIEFFTTNKNFLKRSIFCAILMHTSQSTSHTSPGIGFLNRNHDVNVSKRLSGFEDNSSSRLKSLFPWAPCVFLS